MRPVLVFPFHDPDGYMFRHLESIVPVLKQNFECAFLSIPLETSNNQPGIVQTLVEDNFFKLFFLDKDLPVGAHFAVLYRQAALAFEPDQVLHLCYIDRLAFALQPEYQEQFLKDVVSLCSEDLPLIFHRSEAAWQSHPKNYYEIEYFVTRMGQLLFSKTLDYAWCHLVVQASHLARIMPYATNDGLTMVAEMILQLQDDIKTREVDWLAWEDPFVLSQNAQELKIEREKSLEETRKRLAYAMPMIETLTKFSSRMKS
jgi:hypothetical protein